MHLDFTDEEGAALIKELHDIVENDPYPGQKGPPFVGAPYFSGGANRSSPYPVSPSSAIFSDAEIAALAREGVLVPKRRR